MTRRDMGWILGTWALLFALGLLLIAEFGCAAAGKAAGAVPINIEAPDTATGRDATNAGSWFTIQSVGGSVGIAVVSVVFIAVGAWALTKMYERFVCRYPATCEKGK